jgi:hypothetical protein
MEHSRLRVGETLPPAIRLELDKLSVWEEFRRAGHLPSVGNRLDYLNGKPESLKDYADTLERDFAAYLANRRAYYAIEKRWPDSIFWRRRIDPTGAPATESATAS